LESETGKRADNTGIPERDTMVRFPGSGMIKKKFKNTNNPADAGDAK